MGILLLWRWKQSNQVKGTYNNNLNRWNIERDEEKAERKDRIMQIFVNRQETRNDEVQKLLGVSDATATNYLEELEREGKITQIGKIGHSVSYRKSA